MNKEDFKKKIHLIINDPKIMNVIAVAIIAVFALIVLSFFNKGGSIQNTAGSTYSDTSSNALQNTETANMSYEDQQKESLKNILQNIKGVGEVEVMMYFESSESKVPAMDVTDQSTVTQEKDNNSGERVTNQQNNNSKVVMTNNGNDPLIIKTEKPKITGIIVTAQGAESSRVKYDIAKACSGLYDISMDKINVYPMK
ncbi:MAG: stage III sporulation protein AG [Clostridiaceae bacterium]